jgi:hypothetical protein
MAASAAILVSSSMSFSARTNSLLRAAYSSAMTSELRVAGVVIFMGRVLVYMHESVGCENTQALRLT